MKTAQLSTTFSAFIILYTLLYADSKSQKHNYFKPQTADLSKSTYLSTYSGLI